MDSQSVFGAAIVIYIGVGTVILFWGQVDPPKNPKFETWKDERYKTREAKRTRWLAAWCGGLVVALGIGWLLG